MRSGVSSFRLSGSLAAAAASLAMLCCGNGPAVPPHCSPARAGDAAPTGEDRPAAGPGTPLLLNPAAGALKALMDAEDTDHDRRITRADRGPKDFALPLASGGTVRITGTYPLANLVEELVLQERGEQPQIEFARVLENPVERISRKIRERYWDGLTRRIDATTLERVVADPKNDYASSSAESPAEGWDRCTPRPSLGVIPRFLYVPATDPLAFTYYAKLGAERPWLVVCQLPAAVTPAWVAGLDGARGSSRHGLLGLAIGAEGPIPYVVPGGRFNELYGWDSYFHVLGLIEDERADLARAVVDNLVYEVDHYGQVLNANRTYYLTRSQPPFLSSMVRAVWESSRDSLGKDWLRHSLATVMREYQRVWTGGARRTSICGSEVCLARYADAGVGQPPEVEPGHFDWLYLAVAKERMMAGAGRGDAPVSGETDPRRQIAEYERRYRRRELPMDALRRLDLAFAHDRCQRESGHDTTYRWFDPALGHDRCADYATIDLNSLLLKYELDIAALLAAELGPSFAGHTAARWCERARQRLELMRRLLWDGDRHLFFDYDLSKRQRSSYVTATTLYPLWATAENSCGLEPLADRGELSDLVAAALSQLESPGGLAATARKDAEASRSALAARTGLPERELERQWDYPHGWAPHQVLAWLGLRSHGFGTDADRLTQKWLTLIAENARDYQGTIPEKYDVVRRTHLVFAEYGNVGTEFSYLTEEGFGWMNASYQIGLASLTKRAREAFRRAVAEGR